MPLPGLALKIKKADLSHALNDYIACQSVDLSFNGLAFSSPGYEFNIPDKVNFILTIEEHDIVGSGVICNKRQAPSGMQYGMMFLSVCPELSSLFSHDELSTAELKNIAQKQAEQLVFSLVDEKSLGYLKKQQQLIDACRSYLSRLGEMGARMHDSHDQSPLHPLQAIKLFHDHQQHLQLRWHNSETGQSESITIALQPDPANPFKVNDQQTFKSVFQVLNYLGDKLKPCLFFVQR